MRPVDAGWERVEEVSASVFVADFYVGYKVFGGFGKG